MVCCNPLAFGNCSRRSSVAKWMCSSFSIFPSSTIAMGLSGQLSLQRHFNSNIFQNAVLWSGWGLTSWWGRGLQRWRGWALTWQELLKQSTIVELFQQLALWRFQLVSSFWQLLNNLIWAIPLLVQFPTHPMGVLHHLHQYFGANYIILYMSRYTCHIFRHAQCVAHVHFYIAIQKPGYSYAYYLEY